MAVLTEEQSLLRDAAREWTREKSPVNALRKVRDDALPLGYDPAIWGSHAAFWASEPPRLKADAPARAVERRGEAVRVAPVS